MGQGIQKHRQLCMLACFCGKLIYRQLTNSVVSLCGYTGMRWPCHLWVTGVPEPCSAC